MDLKQGNRTIKPEALLYIILRGGGSNEKVFVVTSECSPLLDGVIPHPRSSSVVRLPGVDSVLNDIS